MSHASRRIRIAAFILLGLDALFRTVPTADAQTIKRSLQEFVDAQGTYRIDDDAGGCVLFVPPVPNYLRGPNKTRGCARASITRASPIVGWKRNPEALFRSGQRYEGVSPNEC